ncbi:hypothetical protein CYMTET_15320 [Cymbomonas tetramitiformis]|uniref:Uncharacterized protein n=1 Tax=Cymbomonas tetramitiformis TaxID=36881 RepID=A0AAE0L9G7_9CHLO|nr:hypothetical protein CYMTET_15320 [Cymbomonas tetramitiformis]|eukprot:gene17253-20527_t
MASMMRTATTTRASVSRTEAPKNVGFSASMRAPVNAAFKGSCVALRTQTNGSRVVMKAGGDIASGYANALVELAQSANALEAIHTDLDALDSVMSEEVIDFLCNPLMTAERKKEVLKKVCTDGSFSAYTGNFLNVLVDKKRIGLIKEVVSEFDDAYCELTDTQVATVTSAVKLENEQQFLIAKKMQEMTGAKNIKLKPQVDPSLIGGFVVQYGPGGSQLVDLSVKGQIDDIAADLMPEATLA